MLVTLFDRKKINIAKNEFLTQKLFIFWFKIELNTLYCICSILVSAKMDQGYLPVSDKPI